MATKFLIAKWQKKFYAQKRIWWVEEYIKGYKEWLPTGNYYDNEESAQLEVDWLKRRGKQTQIHFKPIHSLELAEERWLSEY